MENLRYCISNYPGYDNINPLLTEIQILVVFRKLIF